MTIATELRWFWQATLVELTALRFRDTSLRAGSE